MVEYKVLITTSGIGSRLGNLTKYTNKSLVRVGKKPSISYIIESYPNETNFVITLGHFGSQVKEFLLMAYPEKKFEFVSIDNFEGEGSSLGYSILKTEQFLQCPFIYHASDTIVFDKIDPPNNNWLGLAFKENSHNYRTISPNKKKIINDKGEINSNLCYIGLCGIKDYEKFWHSLKLEYKDNKLDSNLSDCSAINTMGVDWDLKEYSNWLDIGNSSELKISREIIPDKFHLLDKDDESIFIFENHVIKFFYNKKICKNRIERCKELQGLTPKLLMEGENFYKYEYVQGKLLSEVINEKILIDLLDWSEKKLWTNIGFSDNFKKISEVFYFNKTKDRLKLIREKFNIEDQECIINGILVPPAEKLLENLNKEWICDKKYSSFHGDFILENIIYDGNFNLIDWRQDFGGDLKRGDFYYDLAKFNHNLVLNHDILYKNLFQIDEKENIVDLDILRSNKLIDCQKLFFDWIIENKYDLDKIKVLTSIIWLNMSPLHDYKLGKFLYFFGRYNLHKNIQTIIHKI